MSYTEEERQNAEAEALYLFRQGASYNTVFGALARACAQVNCQATTSEIHSFIRPAQSSYNAMAGQISDAGADEIPQDVGTQVDQSRLIGLHSYRVRVDCTDAEGNEIEPVFTTVSSSIPLSGIELSSLAVGQVREYVDRSPRGGITAEQITNIVCEATLIEYLYV